MPDKRRHRGPNPEDKRLFGDEHIPELQTAVEHLSWLLSRGYTVRSAIKLVGDRFELEKRQRIAVGRCACPDDSVSRRKEHQIRAIDLRGKNLALDGYNVLTTIEAALGNGVLLLGRDGCYRDMASLQGNYRKVEETIPALTLLGKWLTILGVETLHWYFDRPVSNSGRLKAILMKLAEKEGWDWQIDLVNDPDAILINHPGIVASADSAILDGTEHWFNLTREVVDTFIKKANVLRLG